MVIGKEIEKKGQIYTVYVDEEDADLLFNYPWRLSYHNYACFSKRRAGIFTTYHLSRLVASRFLPLTNDLIVDHINRDVCLNTRNNLRLSTRSTNAQNTAVYKSSSCGYKGVSFHKRLDKWQARIQVQTKRLHLGYFQSSEEAAKAYNVAALEYHKEFAYLNPV